MHSAPVLTAQCTHAVQMCHDLSTAGVRTAVILFGYPNDRIHHIWEAAATATTLLQRMIDLRRNQKLPRVIIEKRYDRLFNFLLRDDVAVTDQHDPDELS